MLLFLVIVILIMNVTLFLINEDMYTDGKMSYRTYCRRKNYMSAIHVICVTYIIVVMVKFVLTFIINLF